MENKLFFGHKIWNWIKSHKALAVVSTVLILFLIILVVVFVAFIGVGSFQTDTRSVEDSADFSAPSDPSFRASPEAAFDGADAVIGEVQDIPGIEIREGDLTAKSEDAESDESWVRSTTDQFQGYIEESNRHESSVLLRINLTTRVPADDFDNYFQELRDRLEVDNYNIRDFRIEIERRQTSLDIIRDTLDKFATMKEEVQQMPISKERIDLTREITDRELSLKQQEARLQQQIDDSARRGDMATVYITLEEKLKAEIWPEGLANQFREGVRDAIDRIVGIGVAVTTTSFVVLFVVIQWIIYVLIAIIPIWFAYRLLRRLYRRIYKKDQP